VCVCVCVFGLCQFCVRVYPSALLTGQSAGRDCGVRPGVGAEDSHAALPGTACRCAIPIPSMSRLVPATHPSLTAGKVHNAEWLRVVLHEGPHDAEMEDHFGDEVGVFPPKRTV
jgi:hypothetical protein